MDGHAESFGAALLGPPSTFDGLSLAGLRTRKSYKWSAYPSDVLPAFVAEMDLPFSPAVAAALGEAVARGDAGYARDDQLPDAFAAFARSHWNWSADPARMVLVPDVMAGVARAIELLTEPGEGVIITPPVYGPFRHVIGRLSRRVVEAPMAVGGQRWQLDLAAIAEALQAGARAVLLCNPHNPTGSLPSAAELAELAGLASRYGAGVISDEVHAPLTLPGRQFTPYLSFGEQRAITVFSASKAWNVAGLKCALLVAGDAETAAGIAVIPVEQRHPGHLGVLAALAAFDAEAPGGRWLPLVNAHLQRQHDRALALFAAALPAVRVARADAGYLLWLDCRGLGLGEDPAAAFLERGKVALSPGLDFGPQGAGYARLNIATSGELLLEAVRRMRAAQESAGSAEWEPVTR